MKEDSPGNETSEQENSFDFEADLGYGAGREADGGAAGPDEGDQPAADAIASRDEEQATDQSEATGTPPGPNVDGDTATTEDPEPHLYTLPEDPDVFGDLAGQRVPWAQLEKAGLAQKLVTWGHQARHNLRRANETVTEYKQRLEQLEQLEKRLPRAAQGPSDGEFPDVMSAIMQDPKKYADSLKGTYLEPVAKFFKAADESHFVEDNPAAAALMAGLFDNNIALARELAQMKMAMKRLYEKDALLETERAVDHGKSHVDSIVDSMAQQEEFRALADAEYQESWRNWIVDEKNQLTTDLGIRDMPASAVTPSHMAILYREFVRQQAANGKAPATKQTRRATAQDRQLASVGTRGSSGGGGSQASEVDQFLKDMGM